MSRYYRHEDRTGCGCIVMAIYAILFIVSIITDTYKRLNNVGHVYMIASVIVFICLGIAVYFWIDGNEKDKKAKEANTRADKMCGKNYELFQENKKLQLSEKCAWDAIEKERRALLQAHNRQDTEYKNRKNSLEFEYHRLVENCNSRTQNKQRELEQEYESLKRKCVQESESVKEAMKSSNPFRHVAEMYKDFELCAFKEAEKWMRSKKNPAYTSAEIVKNLRIKSREYLSLYKQMEYKYKYLLDVFPELKTYVDDEESLLHLADCNNLEDFEGNRDKVHDWVPDEEYSRLSEDERNQLALDRYKIRGKKTNWEVGIEYELYIGHVLRQDGFFIKQFGIENGLNDLGRDLIAEKAHLDGTRSIYIIQCKRWAEGRPLHENVVCQLFGTTLEYQIAHRELFNTKIVPLLVTTTDLSDTAKEFARRLGVIWKTVPMGEYPMIKCNINNGNKIYHLPFDQQYYNTKITEYTGERYVWTVAEATALGFRRAMKWRGNN